MLPATINNTIFNPDSNPAWASQDTWAIDPTNGNDANVGAGTLQVQTIVFSDDIITGNSISIDFANINLSWETLVQAFDTDNATTLQGLTDLINGNIEATADYDGLHTITITGLVLGSQVLTNRAAVTGGVSQATITITETVSAFTDSLKTWAEFRRRMLAVGGHTTAVDIYLPNNYSGDIMLFDWGNTQGTINIHGTPTILRNGTFTGLTLRNTATNTPNIITDSGVSDWTADIGFTSGRQLCMTSGAAKGICTGIVKNLGSHQARVGSFYDTVNFVETNPSNGDKYSIIGKPFVQDFAFINPSGFINVTHVDLGNDASGRNEVEPNPATFGIEFTNCAIFFYSISATAVYNDNSILKYCPSLYEAAIIQNLGGVIGDITNTEGQNEVEGAGEFECEGGTLFQGVGLSNINNGYLRIYDAGFFDVTNAPAFAVSVGNGGKARFEKIWGSGNTNQGLNVTNTGKSWCILSQCTVTGTGGDVFFCGIVYTWAQILALGGIQAGKGFACILNSGQLELAVSGNIGCVNTITGVNFKATGLTTLFTVPTGRQFILEDVRVQPTNVTSLTISPDFKIGANVTHDDWAAGYTLPNGSTNADMSILAFKTAQGDYFSKVFQSGDIIKFEITTGATATTFTGTLRIFGMLI